MATLQFGMHSQLQSMRCQTGWHCPNSHPKCTEVRTIATCAGAIEHVKMKLDKQSNTRIAFIEFKTNDAAKTALGMCGAQLGSSQIRVSPSKTPVRVNS
jgi:RNA recognition motif-containing protein